jgi:hypothetical protein
MARGCAKRKTIKLKDVASPKLRAKLEKRGAKSLNFVSHVCTKSDVPKYDRPSAKQKAWRKGPWVTEYFAPAAERCHGAVKKIKLRGKHGAELKKALRANGRKIGACIRKLLKNIPHG